jgi:hypothetical protein
MKIRFMASVQVILDNYFGTFPGVNGMVMGGIVFHLYK